ncbi:MAG: radical SAM protein [Acetobacteraceae bacterium]|nr:radical SAM protein [Acetobacteraceae bacterium]
METSDISRLRDRTDPGGAAKRLVRSRYLQVIPRSDGFAVYHSLFGNLKLVDRSVLDILERFGQPRHPEEADGGVGDTVRALRDLRYLVEEGTDERDVIEQRLREREAALRRGALINALQLDISDACNFKCKYCFADRSDHRSPERRRLLHYKDKLMSLETAVLAVSTLLQNCRENGKDRLVVKFFGREPLLNWKVMEALMDRFGMGQGGVAIRWDCTTNASLVTEEVARRFKQYQVNTYVSVDSIAEANDVNRPTKQGENTFESIDRAISLLRSHGVTVFISAVLSSLNFDSFDGRLVDYARSRDVDTAIVLLAMQDDYLMCQRTQTTEAIVSKLFQIYDYGRSRGVKIVGYWHNPLRRLLLSTHRDFFSPKKEDHNSCTATGFQISVEPSGDIFPCRAQSLYLGHITRFKEMLESEAYRYQVMRTYMNVPGCRDCAIEGFCQGDCLGHLEEKYNDIYTLDPSFCDIYRGITRRVLERG